ncbi:UNVERIFIED_CONTAM: Phosphoglycerate mutase-like protein AT74 [Sesamum radiatum]|uniref:Phosphoglycerate mutase-like protein AT74 n=1 Tax=Sesamum radiatum TaxID=300843 RepID=A0AAW2JTX2_SESRA
MATLFSTSPAVLRRNPCSTKCCLHEPAGLNHDSPVDGGLAGFPEKGFASNWARAKPPRPRRIILVRHGQSQGNVDECVYTRVADPKVALTEQGWGRRRSAGGRSGG